MNKMFPNWDRVKRVEPKLLDTPRNYEASLKNAKVISPSSEQLRSDAFLKPKNLAGVEAVALKNVCWLDITGKFDTKNLTPGITYEVVFKVKLEDPAYGWDTPVNIKLVLPDGNHKPQEQKVSLTEIPRYQWVDIIVGEFKPEKNSAGEIVFSMYEHESGLWKKGLFLKGVEICPKYKN
ncbi:hypothetical protein Bca4012_087463 [Brassica carinata]